MSEAVTPPKLPAPKVGDEVTWRSTGRGPEKTGPVIALVQDGEEVGSVLRRMRIVAGKKGQSIVRVVGPCCLVRVKHEHPSDRRVYAVKPLMLLAVRPAPTGAIAEQGARIRQARIAVELLPSELVALAHLGSDETLEEIETGRRELTPESAPDVARVLDVSVAWIRTGKREAEAIDEPPPSSGRFPLLAALAKRSRAS